MVELAELCSETWILNSYTLLQNDSACCTIYISVLGLGKVSDECVGSSLHNQNRPFVSAVGVGDDQILHALVDV